MGAGELLGIVGETGAGKTLTVKSLLALLPTACEPRARSRSASARADRPRPPGVLHAARGRDIGIVLQNPVAMFDPLRARSDTS